MSQSAGPAALLRTTAEELRTEGAPVDLIAVCRQLGLGLELCERPTGGRHRGDLVSVEGGHVVRLYGRVADRERLSANQRCVLAHEIGHFVLHNAGIRPPTRRAEYWAVERQCDDFARMLLLGTSRPAGPNLESASDALEALIDLSRRCVAPEKLAANHLASTYGLPMVAGRIEVSALASTKRAGWLSWLYGTAAGWPHEGEARRAVYQGDRLVPLIDETRIVGRGSRVAAPLDGFPDTWLDTRTETAAIFVSYVEKPRTSPSEAHQLRFDLAHCESA